MNDRYREYVELRKTLGLPTSKIVMDMITFKRGRTLFEQNTKGYTTAAKKAFALDMGMSKQDALTFASTGEIC